MNALAHIAKARRALASGALLLSGDFIEEAGRAAYLAGFHAAHAYCGLRGDGERIKTHRGIQSRFADLARADNRLDPSFVGFLSRAYNLKDQADYEAAMVVTAVDATKALAEAERMVDHIAALLTTQA